MWRHGARASAPGECSKECQPRECFSPNVGQALPDNGLVDRQAGPDLRWGEGFALKGLQRHHPRKGKPVARLGRKTKGRLCSGGFSETAEACLGGSLVAEGMLAVVRSA
jgi:hypothetical protein